MKKIVVTVLVAVSIFFSPAYEVRAQDPITEAIKQGIIKAIKAIDLRIQRLQNRTIGLQNAQKTLENALSRSRLAEISDWVDKQRKLYDEYFEELWKVKNLISYYHKVKDIIKKQERLVHDYKHAFGLFKMDENFSPAEILHMKRVYEGILVESLNDLDALYLVVKSFTTKMTDAKRMEIIDKCADAIEMNYTDMQQYNKQNVILSLQRTKDLRDIERVKRLYAIE